MPLEPYDVARLAEIKERLRTDPIGWYLTIGDGALRDVRWLVSYCELLSSAVVRLEENAWAQLRYDLRRIRRERREFGLPPINENEQKGE